MALAIAGAFFAAYCRKAFGGTVFVLSLILLVAACIPMVAFFNLFEDLNAKRSTKPRVMEDSEAHNPFNDMFNKFHRARDE